MSLLFFANVIAACIESHSICVCPLSRPVFVCDCLDAFDVLDGMKEGCCQVLVSILSGTAVRVDDNIVYVIRKGAEVHVDACSNLTRTSFPFRFIPE